MEKCQGPLFVVSIYITNVAICVLIGGKIRIRVGKSMIIMIRMTVGEKWLIGARGLAM